MKILLAALARLALAQRAGAAAGRYATAAACGLLAAVVVFAALGCAAAALWLFALPYVGPVWAPLIVAGAFLLLALVLLAVARAALRRKSAAPPLDMAALSALLAEAEPLVKQNLMSLLLAALIAGAVAGSGRRG